MLSSLRVPEIMHVPDNNRPYLIFQLEDRVGRFKTLGEQIFARAVLTGNVEAVEVLLWNGADVNAVDKDDYTVLMHLVQQQDNPQLSKMIDVLIAAGADPDHQNTKCTWKDLSPATPFSCAIYSDHLEPNWTAVAALLRYRADTKRIIEPRVMYDFLGQKIVVLKPSSSVMKEYSSHCLTSYRQIARLHAMVKNQLQEEVAFKQASPFSGVVTDMLIESAFYKPKRLYSLQLRQLQKDEQILKQALWKFESQTYIRLASSLMLVGSIFAAKRTAWPWTTVGLTSTAFLAGMSTLLKPIHPNFDRQATAQIRLSDDRMVLTTKWHGLFTSIKKHLCAAVDPVDVPEPPAYR